MIRKIIALLVSATLITACDAAPEPGDTDTDTDAAMSSSSEDGSSTGDAATGDTSADSSSGSTSDGHVGDGLAGPGDACINTTDCVGFLVCEPQGIGKATCEKPECYPEGQFDAAGQHCENDDDCTVQGSKYAYECRTTIPGTGPLSTHCTPAC